VGRINKEGFLGPNTTRDFRSPLHFDCGRKTRPVHTRATPQLNSEIPCSGQRRGQVTLFIIIAIVIVAAVVIFFAVRGDFGAGGVSAELSPVFDYYQSCIEAETRTAVQLAGMGGGSIDAKDC